MSILRPARLILQAPVNLAPANQAPVNQPEQNQAQENPFAEFLEILNNNDMDPNINAAAAGGGAGDGNDPDAAFAQQWLAMQQALQQLQQQQLGNNLQRLHESDINSVPEFRGEAQLLPRFIRAADQLVQLLGVPLQPDHLQNARILRGILSRIKGSAELQLSNFEFANWAELKEKLLEFYGDFCSIASQHFDSNLILNLSMVLFFSMTYPYECYLQ